MDSIVLPRHISRETMQLCRAIKQYRVDMCMDMFPEDVGFHLLVGIFKLLHISREARHQITSQAFSS